MTHLISIEQLSFDYGKDKVLKNVNAGFQKGKLSVILGRNGSGKSTLFKIIAGLEKNYKGNIRIAGKERRKIKTGTKSPVRLGFLTQFHQTTFPFKVMDVVLTGRASFSRFSPQSTDYEAVEDILQKFNLTHLKDKSYTSLSGGERQLVLLCRVLVQKPDILMLDEPTNHLDLHYQVAVLEVIRQLVNEGTTVLCVMHDPNLAFQFGDDFFVMRQNELVPVQSLEKDELKQLLEDTYQVPLHVLDNQGTPMFAPQLK
ncbi:ABC transporter ATP-binding protein [Chryseobacterium indologenes]|uniref:ABC transporter ATP-binding protein n=3 Tax=Chryseobacterium indologenes TaxID=253 RepID=A0AAD0YPH7_CHRID|nr:MULTISPECIES: ABC transporter ATP-binding protein [Chryseobacterium]ATN04807.1 ABC transporter ATP-binding protein [Chryseobacterium indologenes]AYY86442.1 ABC transporter ATP-binding protein [Chryseobacterium indologenes]AZB16444.1 ABC transporter ATP-binding protein [Chryseobacterium indologenes]QIX83334.1 ABC transporter ATP-binding protein [Chryseobacterium indologenes]QPQ50932.1 ABC transporter ATP-binding protein [Chryseobacterium indologenes]